MSTSTLNQLWTKWQPKVGHLRPWSLAVYVHVSCHKFEKLSPHGKKCIFIWYLKHSIGYVFIGENKNETFMKLSLVMSLFLNMIFQQRENFRKIFNLWKWLILIVEVIKINYNNMFQLENQFVIWVGIILQTHSVIKTYVVVYMEMFLVDALILKEMHYLWIEIFSYLPHKTLMN